MIEIGGGWGDWEKRLMAVALLCVFSSIPVEAQQQPQILLRITSPASGALVHPGETVGVVVAPEPGVKPAFVGLVAQDPLRINGPQPLYAPPYRFTVKVPARVAAAGQYSAGAVGRAGSGVMVISPPTFLDVEPAASLKRLKVDLHSLTFHRKGERVPLRVTGLFADGSGMDITRSSRITYTSSDPKVVTVSPEGVVTAVGRGCPGCSGVAVVHVKYGNQYVLVQVSTSRLPDSPPN